MYVSNLILLQYAHRADSKCLRLSSLNFEANKAIFSALRKNKIFVKIDKKENTYFLRRVRHQFPLPAHTRKRRSKKKLFNYSTKSVSSRHACDRHILFTFSDLFYFLILFVFYSFSPLRSKPFFEQKITNSATKQFLQTKIKSIQIIYLFLH